MNIMKDIQQSITNNCFKLVNALLICTLIFSACQKEFLEKKPDRAKLVPKTVADFQALLDAELFYSAPELQEISADDFVTSDQGAAALSELIFNVYTWSDGVFLGMASLPEWNICYTQVFTANVILEGMQQIVTAERDGLEYNSVKGNALFQRAFAYYNLAQLFAAPYQSSTASTIPGIPLRPVSDVNAHYPRGTIQQTYDQIIRDLEDALILLPEQVNYKHRPSKAAAVAMLARVYLTMGNYTKAMEYADRTLKLKNELLDYSQIKGSAINRIMPGALPNGNAEVIYYKGAVYDPFPVAAALVSVVPELYQSYDKDDLRKTLFFRDRGNGVFTFRGGYGGSVNIELFTGLATDEIYLIRAECAARNGNLNLALSDLNHLLQTRWIKEKYLPYSSSDQEEVLRIVLKERRKELICRGMRWTDLRRLNLEPRFAITLTRTVKGKVYQLLPNGNRYTFPLPDYEVNTGLAQNP
jgi:tetratricopeptide (TPR) repeat protein